MRRVRRPPICAGSTACRKATLYNWKARYGGMDLSDAKRLKALEEIGRKVLEGIEP
jgi:hypothetical protein